eukprot:Rhum_TRINITY_DN15227_c0_g2::Rhum_TRINITY_DN15227_c0_g2_i10::g.145186::m.145186
MCNETSKHDVMAKARVRGKLTRGQREEQVAKWSELSDDELRVAEECLVTRLKHTIYEAARCDEDTGFEDYVLLQRCRDELKLVRLLLSWRSADGDCERPPFDKWYAAQRLQGLCRWHVARRTCQALLRSRRQEFEDMYAHDDRHEAALLIQGMFRGRQARKVVRARSLSQQATGASAAASAASKRADASSPSGAVGDEGCGGQLAAAVADVTGCGDGERRIPVPSSLLPGYTLHDVSADPIADADLRAIFARLTTGDTLDKADFRAYFRGREQYGLEASDLEFDRLLTSSNVAASSDTLTFDEFAIVMLRLAQW